MSKLVSLGSEADFKDGQYYLHELDLVDVLVGKVNGKWYAFNAQCPHGAYNVGKGLVKAGKAVCPGHGLTFDLKTGTCLEEPHRHLTAYSIVVNKGEVFINLSEGNLL